MSGICPLTLTLAAPLQPEGAHAPTRDAHSPLANHALAHAHRAHHHTHNHKHHKHTTRQNTTTKQATPAAAQAAAACEATHTLMPASAHASDHPVACEAAPRRSPHAHYSACSPMLHELGKHAISTLHTRRRKAQLHGPVPCKQSPRLHTACVPPATACERKQQRAAAQRAARLSLLLSIYSPNPRKRYRASPSGVAQRQTDGGPQGSDCNTNRNTNQNTNQHTHRNNHLRTDLRTHPHTHQTTNRRETRISYYSYTIITR
jgi:hypothetical protein